MRRKTIALIPFVEKQNHYSSLIASALELAGYNVVHPKINKLNPFSVYDEIAIDTVIIYWPNLFYTGKNKITSAVKLIATLIGLRKLRKKPTVYSLENYLPHDVKFVNFHKSITACFLSRSDALICTSNSAKEKFDSMFPLYADIPTWIIPHPSYSCIYEQIETAEIDMRQRLNIGHSEKVCLSLGLLRPYKGLSELLSSFAEIANKSRRLLICGKPHSHEALASIKQEIQNFPTHVRNQITLVPSFVSDEEIPSLFALASFVSCGYAVEPANPGPPVLALHFGKPVYASKDGVVPSVVGRENMYSFDPNCSISRVNVLQEAFDDPDRNSKCAKLRELDKTKHSLVSLANIFNKMIEGL